MKIKIFCKEDWYNVNLGLVSIPYFKKGFEYHCDFEDVIIVVMIHLKVYIRIIIDDARLFCSKCGKEWLG